jgi:hypothetical protein
VEQDCTKVGNARAGGTSATRRSTDITRKRQYVSRNFVINVPQPNAKAQDHSARQWRIAADLIQELPGSQALYHTIRRGTGCGTVTAVLDHGHLTEPLSPSHVTQYDEGFANLAQDFDLALDDAQHMFSRAALMEKYVPLREFSPRCHRLLLAAL